VAGRRQGRTDAVPEVSAQAIHSNRDAILDLARSSLWRESQLRADKSGALYLADIEDVAAVVTKSNRQAVDSGGLAVWLDWEVWCSLVGASLHSMSNRLSTVLLTGLVEDPGHTDWTISQAVDAARLHTGLP
jgi:hypothetical protein